MANQWLNAVNTVISNLYTYAEQAKRVEKDKKILAVAAKTYHDQFTKMATNLIKLRTTLENIDGCTDLKGTLKKAQGQMEFAKKQGKVWGSTYRSCYPPPPKASAKGTPSSKASSKASTKATPNKATPSKALTKAALSKSMPY